VKRERERESEKKSNIIEKRKKDVWKRRIYDFFSSS
jgi:hypothetical protein